MRLLKPFYRSYSVHLNCANQLSVPIKDDYIRQKHKHQANKQLQNQKKFNKELMALSNTLSLDQLDSLRNQLVSAGWSEDQQLGKHSRPKFMFDKSTQQLSLRSRVELSKYFQKQKRLWSNLKRKQHEKLCKRLAEQHYRRREKKRVKELYQPISDHTQLFPFTTERVILNKHLNKFRNNVRETFYSTNNQPYEGWPPFSAICLGKLLPLHRDLYVFNKRTPCGTKRIPVLAICVNNTPVIFFREREIRKIQQVLPQLIEEAKNFRKLKRMSN